MSDFEHQDTTNWNPREVRRSQEPDKTPRRRRKRRMKWFHPVIYLFVVLLISVILASFGWELASDLCAFNRGTITTHTVEIAPGDNLDAVIAKLHQAGLIKHPFFFRLFADVTNAESKIGAGTYTLNTDMDYRALVVGMRATASNLATAEVKVTIPEGYTVRDICALLAEKGVATEAELLEAARNAAFDYDFIDNDSHEISRLEGYLFPDTYDFYTPENPQRALNRLLSNFARKLSAWEDLLAEAAERGYDLKKIVTIASLIEKETDGTDQVRIASVIYNRLEGSGSRAGTYGLLQIDASVLYGIPDHTGPITSADLESSSPYNLYKNAGLPPTAIANPGAQSMYAALVPDETDYYYYALGKDNKHRFFTNYSEFSRFLSSSDYIGN
ncbi:MAG: endolytic transglycosylase MltG [Oscillibacter sp.]|nr:endolytic transglycosylase MltG [Oscillibacter sp.]